MKSKNLLILLSLVLVASANIFGQTAKNLTNDNLEKFREARLKADAEYREKRRRQGLPPLEDVEREREKIAQERREFSAKLARERSVTERFYQNQVLALRAEIVAIDAEISYVRARLRGIPKPRIYYAVNYLPFYNYYPGNFPQPIYYRSNRRVNISDGRIGNSTNSNVRIAGTNQSIQTNAVFVSSNEQQSRPPFATGTLVVPFTFPNYDQSAREQLNANLRSLQQTRAGLFARWQLLEEEARQNGVRID